MKNTYTVQHDGEEATVNNNVIEALYEVFNCDGGSHSIELNDEGYYELWAGERGEELEVTNFYSFEKDKEEAEEEILKKVIDHLSQHGRIDSFTGIVATDEDYKDMMDDS